jgi:hypothetical protein
MTAMPHAVARVVLLMAATAGAGAGAGAGEAVPYSGLYLPNTTFNAENYAGSWMISRLKFFNAQTLFEDVLHLEHISLWVTSPMVDPKCEALMTRDFLDFHVEHLSSTSNYILGNGIAPSLIEKMERRVEALQRGALLAAYSPGSPSLAPPSLGSAASGGSRLDSRQVHATLVLIPFHLSRVQRRKEGTIDKTADETLRKLFFKATFWATYRNFRNIVVGVSSEKHLNIVQSFGLPIFAVLDLSADFYYHDISIKDPRTLPKRLLLRAMDIWKSHPDWQVFRYVFFTEADQILYARDLSHVYDAIDQNRPHRAVVPHRMQVRYYYCYHYYYYYYYY